jgi:adenine-specific DNA methylase
MKKLLVQILNREVLLMLKRFGEPILISENSNIYSIQVNPSDVFNIEKTEGVLCVEEDEQYECQPCTC